MKDFKVYLVGGMIRNRFLKVKSNDADYAVVCNDLTLNALTAMDLLASNLRDENFEIFYKDNSKYYIRGKYPSETIFSDYHLSTKESTSDSPPLNILGTLEDDLSQRDFTVNAIAQDIETGKYIDLFNGFEDLQNKLLVPIYYRKSIDNSPIRILRAIRLSVLYDFKLSTYLSKCIKEFDYINNFKSIPIENIEFELSKSFKANTIKTLNVIQKFSKLENYLFNKLFKLKPIRI